MPRDQDSVGEFAPTHNRVCADASRATFRRCALLQWAADQEQLSLHLQGVLIRLVKLMDDAGAIAIAQTEIAPLIGLGARQTRAAIKELVAAGKLKRTRRGAVGRGRAPDLLSANCDMGEVPPLSENAHNGDTAPVSPPPSENSQNGDSGGPSPLPLDNPDNGDNAATLPISEIEDAEFVDNSPPPYKGTGARAQNLELITTGLELNPERADQPNTPARAKKSLVQDDCDRIGSPWLDPSKSQMLTTRPAKLVRWAAQLDLETELIPIMKAKLACNGYEPIVSWNYFEFVINDFIKDKKADQEARHDQSSRAPVQSASYPRAKRSRHIDALFGDEPDGSPIDLGRLDSCAVK